MQTSLMSPSKKNSTRHSGLVMRVSCWRLYSSGRGFDFHSEWIFKFVKIFIPVWVSVLVYLLSVPWIVIHNKEYICKPAMEQCDPFPTWRKRPVLCPAVGYYRIIIVMTTCNVSVGHSSFTASNQRSSRWRIVSSFVFFLHKSYIISFRSTK